MPLSPFIAPRRGCREWDGSTLGGSGVVTNIHITDYEIEGPIATVSSILCDLKHLTEFDVDGGEAAQPAHPCLCGWIRALRWVPVASP